MPVRKTAFFIIFLIFFAVPGQAAAAQRACSISLTFAYRGRAVSGGSITLSCVTGLAEDTSAQTAQALAAQSTLTGETQPIRQGQVHFDGLAPGVYLLVQEKNIPGFLPISPFLITLPLEQSGTLLHHVSAAPKLAPYPASPETGQPCWPFIMLWVSGAVLVLAGAVHLCSSRTLRDEIGCLPKQHQ